MKFEFSAGGIVFKNQKSRQGRGLAKAAKIKDKKDEVLILVCQHSQHHGWVFPKGLIGDHVKGEIKEETALREVKEETGILGKIVKALEPVEYWYVFEGEKIKKTVYYFLMEYVSGDINEHDNEMENVEWIEKEKVEERLTYLSDKKAWQDFQNYI